MCSGSNKEDLEEKNILKINIDFYVNYIAEVQAISNPIKEGDKAMQEILVRRKKRLLKN